MNYWLVKSEPAKYSWEQFVKDKVTHWDGVRNYRARNNMKAMDKGDMIFFYHSNEGLEIVGIAEVARTAYQDPTTDDANWVVVDIKPLKKLNNPIALATIKQTPALSEMELIKQSRLSVSAVTEEEFQLICDMAK